MLAEVYGWFSEGFDTADLREAQTLLDADGRRMAAVSRHVALICRFFRDNARQDRDK